MKTLNSFKRAFALFLGTIMSVAATGCQGPTNSSETMPSNPSSSFPVSELPAGVREGVGYEIFVGSFKDSNGDGTGDLKGIEEKLPYLRELGIKRVWLTPIFPSPSYHKYDCVNYYAIDASFGTLEDLDSLVSSAHELGIEIILDLVINHTSTAHAWFQQSVEDYANNNTSSDSKKDWYVWSDTYKSGYQRNQQNGAYYEANFSSGMPELNLANPAVIDEIRRIASFWLIDHDIDGFRLDAVRYYFFNDTGKNTEFCREFGEYCWSIKPSAYLIGEAWESSPTQSGINQYAESGLTFFNFPTAETRGNGPGAAVSISSSWNRYSEALVNAQTGVESASSTSQLAMFIDNHDTNRANPTIRGQRADAVSRRKLAFALTILTPGTPWLYYGSEIDLWGSRSSSDSQDYARRLAMVWGGDETRCDNPGNYNDSEMQVTTGVAEAKADSKSLYNHIRKLIYIRNTHNELFQYGKYSECDMTLWGNETALEDNVMCLKITHEGSEYYLFHSKATEAQTIKVPGGLSIIEDVQADDALSHLENDALTIQPTSSVLIG